MPDATLPDAFVWTKMGAESGEALAAIIRRKDYERQLGAGMFAWGIGNALGGAVGAMAAEVSDPLAVFSAMPSKPNFASLMRRGFEQLDHIAEMKQRQAVNDAREKIEERVAELVRQRTIAHERLKKAVADWEEATGLKFDMYGGPSKDLIKLAQQLAELRRRYSGNRGDSGFGFLADLADDLVRAADTVRNALTECGVTEQMTAEEEFPL